MKNYPYVPSMVQAITVLTVLKMMTKAQTSCGSGSMSGKIMYERLPNTQLSGFDDDIVKDTAPPFMVLEKCQDLCLRDRASNNIVRTCSSFDFQPGSRIATYNGGPEYEESTCYLTREQAAPEGIGNLMLVPNSVHFTEVCIRAQKAERECPNRRYIFERHPRKKLKLTSGDIKEVPATNRSECEDKCLSEFSFVCRSASFDSAMRMCMLSSFTRRTRPDLLEDDPNSDYLENTCLNAERRCGGLAIFIKEENKRLGGPFEVDLFNNITLQECQAMCVRAEKYFCRSVEYDEMTKQCTLSEEDSISQKDDLGTSSSLTHHFYDYACLDSPASSEYPDNSVTSHLFSGKHPETAFHRFRNSMLGGDHRTELSGKSLSECLDECLRSPTFQCRSAVYSERYRSCRLSLHNQRDGMRIIYDADYDYYENLMHHGGDTNMNMPGRQPGEEYHPRPRPRPGQYPSSDGYGTYPPSSGGSGYYPPRRYRPSGNGLDSHSDGIYPHDRYYPSSGGSDGNFRERYPIDSYPPSSSGGSGGRYPSRYPNRYPTRPLDEYPGRPRYPILPSDNYPDGPKYPIRPSDEYPDRRFPLRPLDEYPDRKYPGRPLDEYPDRKYPGRPLDEYPDRKYPVRPLDEYPDRKYPARPSDEYPDRKYPGRPLDEYPDRKYPARPIDGYPDRKYPARPLDEYPDRKYPVRPLDDYPEKKYPARPVDEYPDRPKYPARPLDEYPDRAKFPARPLDEYPDVTKYPTRPLDEYPDRPKYPTGPVVSRYPLPNRRIPDDRYIYDYDRFGDTYGGQKDRDKYDRPDGFYGQNGDTYNERYDFRNENRYGGHRGNGYGGDRYNKFGGNRYGDNFDDNRDNRYNDRKYSFYGDGQSGGSQWFFRPNRRPGRPLNENVRPISPGPDGPIYDDHGIGPVRPYGSRCDEADNFKQVGVKQRIRKDFVIRFLPAISLLQCQSACVDSKDFTCRSFNYRESPQLYEGDRINCELSDRDSRDLELSNPQFFENAPNFDFYERSNSRQGADGDCLDVSQLCNEDGMEFTLRTTEGFYGRIYAYGHYDQCFFRGNGGTVNVLRISGTQGYPECGTQRYGDTMTNIVVVQFSDFVQTGKDKRFNLTCLFRGPGEAVVSSAFIGAGSGSPIPIEYLPAENTLSSKVRLLILYQGRPTTTIAVGDPLTFKLEAQDGYNYISDIFATNVVARDPYSGRSVQLIDQRGCPVDSYVFPELDRGRSGDTLEAHFNAFKIPESNFLVFEATVRTCREGCQPAYCQSGSGRSEPSFGRRKRDVNETLLIEGNNTMTEENASNDTAVIEEGNDSTAVKNEIEEPEYVREMIEVFESREELQQEARRSVAVPETVCITSTEYQGLISALLALIILLIAVSLVVGLAYRRYWTVMRKNVAADHSSSRVSSFTTTRSSGVSAISIFGTGFQKPFTGFSRARNFPKDDIECPEPAPGGPFEDPSEPIYTDPSLFERSRSLRSISVSPKRRQSQGQQH